MLTTLDSMIQAFKDAKAVAVEREGDLLGILTRPAVSDAFFSKLKSQKSQFDDAVADADESMSTVESKAAGDGKVNWTRKLLSKEAGLLIDERRLSESVSDRAVERGNWGEVVKLRATLDALKGRADTTAKQKKFLDKMEHEFLHVSFERRDLRRIADALGLKLSEDIEQHTVTQDVTKHSQAVAELLPELQNCEHLLEVAFHNGDMALAEDISDNQIKLYEKLLEVTEEQYPMLQARKDQTREFMRRRRWAIFRMANRDINGVIESKHRQVEACEEDAAKLKAFLEERGDVDKHGRETFLTAMAESDAFLRNNKCSQEDTFDELTDLYNRVRECEARLKQQGDERQMEINRRVDLIETEASRTHDHRVLVATSEEYLGLLHASIEGADRVREVCKQLNDFLLDGCDNITTKFEKSEGTMTSMISSLDKQYLRLFSGYAVAVGRLKYRKSMRRRRVMDRKNESVMLLEVCNDTLDAFAKKHADDRTEAEDTAKDLEEQIRILKEKLDSSAAKFEHCAESLRSSGVQFVHPIELAERANTERQSAIVEFKDMMNVTERKIEQQISRDIQQVQDDIDEHRLKIMHKQAATHMRHAHQATARAPRPPRSQTERSQAASFARYKDLIAHLNEPKDAKPSTAVTALPTAKVGSSTESPASASPPPSSRLPAVLEGKTVVATYSYKSRAQDELSFLRGDRIVCIGPGPESGWYLGVTNQRTGLFPLNYVATPTDPDDVLAVD